MIPKAKIIAFLKQHPTPNDILVHKYAIKHGYSIDAVEEAIYKIAGQAVRDKYSNSQSQYSYGYQEQHETPGKLRTLRKIRTK